jgi:hypothetical protein
VENMQTYTVQIEGVAPGMLMHKFSDAAMAELVDPVKITGKVKLSPEVEAENGAYRPEPGQPADTGKLCIPSHNLFESLCAAASQHQVQGRGKATYKEVFKGALLIEPAYLVLTDAKGEALTEYEIDARPARIQRARIMRHRPCLRYWRTEATLTVLHDEMIPKEVINAVLVTAGQMKGVGDYRPVFGRFVVTKFG